LLEAVNALVATKQQQSFKTFLIERILYQQQYSPFKYYQKLQRNVKEELSQLSHHMHNSAFHKVTFGQNLNGIASATHTDLMHAYCYGVLVSIIKILLVPLKNQERSQLDSISLDMFWKLKSNKKMNIQGTCSQRESQI